MKETNDNQAIESMECFALAPQLLHIKICSSNNAYKCIERKLVDIGLHGQIVRGII